MQKTTQRMPEGVTILYFVQAFSTFAFAILYSSLSLFLTKQLGLESKTSNSIVGLFLAYNYLLHLLGGIIGGKLISNRMIFLVTTVMQCFGLWMLAAANQFTLLTGLSLFLAGCGLNVTSFNSILTQRFKPDDDRREKAFFINYAAMNLGFCSGFLLSGLSDYSNQYQNLFYMSIVTNVITLALLLTKWNSFKEDASFYASRNKNVKSIIGYGITFLLVPLLIMSFKSSGFSNQLIVIISVLMFSIILMMGLRQKDSLDKQRIITYLILAITSILFWMIYYTGPMGITHFIKNNVDRNIFHYKLATQWLLNINSFVIIAGAPLLAKLISHLKDKGYNITVSRQFTAGFLLMSISFYLLSAGIKTADSMGYTSSLWIVLHFVTQASAELMLAPVGYAMIGRIAPSGMQGLLMGTWMMVSGVAASASHYFSNVMTQANATNPLQTNADYLHVFNQFGLWSSLGALFLFSISRKIGNIIDGKRETQLDQEVIA